jgi:hypothetical protein
MGTACHTFRAVYMHTVAMSLIPSNQNPQKHYVNAREEEISHGQETP